MARMAKPKNLLAFTRKPQKNYKNVPEGLMWAIPIHECLEKPEVKAESKRLQAESLARITKEFNERKKKEKALAPRLLEGH